MQSFCPIFLELEDQLKKCFWSFKKNVFGAQYALTTAAK